MDGQKEEHAYGNTIEIFCEKTNSKTRMSIVTDSTPVEDLKIRYLNVMALYVFRAPADVKAMSRIEAGIARVCWLRAS